MRQKILCIEDDLTIQALVDGCLKDFQVNFARTIKEAEAEVAKNTFSAILIDVELPDGDGIRFYSKLIQDEKYRNIPTIVLSGHTDISNKLLAFSVGVDDFVAKPFDPLELNARVVSKLKKINNQNIEKRTRKIGDVELDFDRQKAVHLANGSEVDLNLTAIELKLLTLFSKRLEQVYSREQILSEVWGETFITDRTVDSHIAHLRTKIEATKLLVETVKNFGYRLNLKK